MWARLVFVHDILYLLVSYSVCLKFISNDYQSVAVCCRRDSKSDSSNGWPNNSANFWHGKWSQVYRCLKQKWIYVLTGTTIRAGILQWVNPSFRDVRACVHVAAVECCVFKQTRADGSRVQWARCAPRARATASRSRSAPHVTPAPGILYCPGNNKKLIGLKV